MNIEEWFKEKQKEFENDPEYLKEYIRILEEESDHLRKQVKRLAFSTRASKMKINISYVSGVEGPHIAIGDIRVAGPKAWGGGKVLKEWDVELKDIIYALNCAFKPSHQPLQTFEDEVKKLHNLLVERV